VIKRLFSLLPFLLPLYVVRFQIGPIPTTLLEIGIIALAITWLVIRGNAGVRDAWTRSSAWHWPVAFWILAGMIATIVSPVTLPALGLFRAYFIEPLIIFFIGFDLIQTDENRNALWRSFGITTILLAAYAVVQLLAPWLIPSPWNIPPNGPRATSIFPFPNALALFVTPIAALAIARVIAALNTMKERHEKIISRDTWMDLAIFIAGGVAILAAQSDGGLVALAAATFVAMLLHKHARKFAIELAIVGIIAIAAIAPLRAHIENVVLLKDWSGKVRMTIWQETTAMLMDRPLQGAGLGAYPTVILPYHSSRNWMEVFQYPHNIILNLWSEVGLLGVVVFAWLIITWIKPRRRTPRPFDLVVVTAILVHGLVDVPYFKNDLAVAFWLLILLTTIYEPKTTDR
jgi:O-antigen ligase